MEHILSLAQQYALPFIAVISVVVFVHEYGHYLVARACGIKIISFSIGFGPRLFGWTDGHGTEWRVACLPFGGYVKMFGDADPASTPDKAVKELSDEEKKLTFFYQPVNKRIAVVAAGPLSNYLFAIITLAVLFILHGQPFSPPSVGALVENGVAARAGLQLGDRVVSVDGNGISRFEDIKRIIGMNSGTPVPVIIDRSGQTLTYTLTPEIVVQKDRLGGEHKSGRIGIVAEKIAFKKLTPLEALGQAVIESWKMSADTLKGLGQIITGVRGSEEIGGPLRIAEMSGRAAQDGMESLVWLMAIISINLGLVNLFPIPLLDGGHLLYFSMEKLRGRPLSDETQEVGFRIGLMFVVTLMVFATWNDLVQAEIFSKIKALFS
ncbi:MAG: RIP metalloprotease RseP [Alphaproteobacteria bacterium]|nr:RIP metalloprotease RseP [Alphaproteobacteria bacterium]